MPEPATPNPYRNDWLTPGRFAALLGLLVFAAFPQVILGLQTFVYRDFGYFSYPIAAYWRDSFWRGEIPLWNPLSNCGIPFLAQWNTQVLYPPALFYVLFPPSWAVPVFCLLHIYLAGLGMFFLCRRWAGNDFSSAFAAIVYAFSGLVLNSLMWPATIPGFGWMPWVVLLTGRAWREGGRMVLLAALVGAMQMLSGAVEVILLTWLLLGVLCVVDAFQAGRPDWKILLRGGLVVLLVAALCAAQLLPFLDFVKHSHRQQNFDSATWPMPLTGWANFLTPLFQQHRSVFGPFVQLNQAWTFSYYTGALTVALAAWALWRARDRRVRALGGLALLCLLLALGDATPVYKWLRTHVGVMGMIRFPVKYAILPAFVFAVMSAIGSAKLLEKPDAKRWLLLAGGVGLFVLGLAALSPHYEPLPADARYVLLNGLTRLGLFVLMAGLLAVCARATQVRWRRLAQLGVLIVAWLDLWTHNPHPPTVNRSVYQPALPRSLPLPRFGESRAMLSCEALATFNHSFIADPHADYISRRFAAFNNCNLIEGFPKVDGFFPLRLRNEALFSQLVNNPDTGCEEVPAILDLMGVSQITTTSNIFEWTARTNCMPLITGGQKPSFDGEAPMMKHLVSTNFDPRAEVWLLREARSIITATNAANVTVSDATFAAHRITATVKADAPAMVVVAQMYHHNWRAYVSGQPVTLLRADLGFQAFQVAAGTHQIRLAYEDRRFYLGAAVSLATLLGCGVAWSRTGRSRTKHP